MVIIILSILTFCLQTVPVFAKHEAAFDKLEYFYCAYFSLEFVVRMSVCPSIKQFVKSPMTWIDFVSTMQFYYNFCTEQKTLDFLFVSRLIRIFRLFRFFKNLSGMQVIAKTLKSSAQELCLLAILMCIPMLIFSTLMYYAEKVWFTLVLFVFLFFFITDILVKTNPMIPEKYFRWENMNNKPFSFILV